MPVGETMSARQQVMAVWEAEPDAMIPVRLAVDALRGTPAGTTEEKPQDGDELEALIQSALDRIVASAWEDPWAAVASYGGTRQALEALTASLPTSVLKASDNAIMEQAYIVARGVRPMALLGHVEADPTAMLRVSTRIERLAEPGVVPFVFDRRDGVADVGYASAPWVADTYRWAIQGAEEPHLSRIVGLLLGYAPTAIAEYESQRGRRWFADPLTSAGRESSSRHACTSDGPIRPRGASATDE